jgi:hypothetical protein
MTIKPRRRWIALGIPLGFLLIFEVATSLDLGFNSPSSCADWPGRLHRAQAQLSSASLSSQQRFYLLGDAAKAAVELGSVSSAEAYANELLQLAPQFPRDWNYGNAIHDGHMVLGRVALRRGDLARARAELMASSSTPGSPQLDSFGPNMSLARDMLREGERDSVLRYLDQCGSFWVDGRSRLRLWSRLIEYHLRPDFGANLLF